jgi:hypothetical protein
MAGFTQIIEMQTSRIDEVEALIGELRNRLDDGGSSTSRRGTITADRDRDGFYLSIITAGGPDRRPLAGIEVFTRRFTGEHDRRGRDARGRRDRGGPGDMTCSRWGRAARPRRGKGYALCDQ